MLTVSWTVNSRRTASLASMSIFKKILLTNWKEFKKELQIYLQLAKAVSEIPKKNPTSINLIYPIGE